jgi:hypothetical protein
MNPEQQPSPNSTPPVQTGGWAPQPQTPIAPSAFDAAPAASTQPLGENYLNQIAATESVPVHKFAMIGIIGGVLVLVIVFLAIIMGSNNAPSLGTQAKAVNGRIATIKTIADDQQKHLGDSTLSAANVMLSSILTTMTTDLTANMKEKKITLSSATSKTEKTYSSTLSAKLDDAYQRGTLDRTYAPQMVYELTVLRSKLTVMKNIASSKSTKEFCATSITSLTTMIEKFQAFSSTN